MCTHTDPRRLGMCVNINIKQENIIIITLDPAESKMLAGLWCNPDKGLVHGDILLACQTNVVHSSALVHPTGLPLSEPQLTCPRLHERTGQTGCS